MGNTWWRKQQSILKVAQIDMIQSKIELACQEGKDTIYQDTITDETREHFKQMGVCFKTHNKDKMRFLDCTKSYSSLPSYTVVQAKELSAT